MGSLVSVAGAGSRKGNRKVNFWFYYRGRLVTFPSYYVRIKKAVMVRSNPPPPPFISGSSITQREEAARPF